MKHKVSDLEGALLDAAVAKAEGWSGITGVSGRPSTSWQAGGPIIERERIATAPCYRNIGYDSRAFADEWDGFVAESGRAAESGPTPLIAAMRAYVASKFGDEVELP